MYIDGHPKIRGVNAAASGIFTTTKLSSLSSHIVELFQACAAAKALHTISSVTSPFSAAASM